MVKKPKKPMKDFKIEDNTLFYGNKESGFKEVEYMSLIIDMQGCNLNVQIITEGIETFISLQYNPNAFEEITRYMKVLAKKLED